MPEYLSFTSNGPAKTVSVDTWQPGPNDIYIDRLGRWVGRNATGLVHQPQPYFGMGPAPEFRAPEGEENLRWEDVIREQEAIDLRRRNEAMQKYLPGGGVPEDVWNRYWTPLGTPAPEPAPAPRPDARASVGNPPPQEYQAFTNTPPARELLSWTNTPPARTEPTGPLQAALAWAFDRLF